MADFTGKVEQTILGNARFTGTPRVTSVANQFWGRMTVGSVRNVIVAPAVAADSLILCTLQNLVVGSEVSNPAMSVISKDPGVGFVAGTPNSFVLANSYTLAWLIINPQ